MLYAQQIRRRLEQRVNGWDRTMRMSICSRINRTCMLAHAPLLLLARREGSERFVDLPPVQRCRSTGVNVFIRATRAHISYTPTMSPFCLGALAAVSISAEILLRPLCTVLFSHVFLNRIAVWESVCLSPSPSCPKARGRKNAGSLCVRVPAPDIATTRPRSKIRARWLDDRALDADDMW